MSAKGSELKRVKQSRKANLKNKAYKDRSYYLNKYSMKKNTSIFLKKINL